jgi:hypothetical protein
VKSANAVCQENLAFRFYDGCAAERSLAVLGSCYRAEGSLVGSAASRLPAALLLASALFVVSANWHRLQRRFDQTECDTQVVQPVLDFLFHGAPFRVVPSDRNSVAASH